MGQRDRGTERQRDRKTERQTKRQRKIAIRSERLKKTFYYG